MSNVAELIAAEVAKGNTLTFGPQPDLSPAMVHVTVTDPTGKTVGRGDCVATAHDLRELAEQAVADLELG